MPRVRRSVPVVLDLSEPAVLDKFVSESVASSNELFDRYTSHASDIGMKSIDGDEAWEQFGRSSEYIRELSGRCDVFCPHISSLPYSRPHFLLPSVKAVSCIECVSEWFASISKDDSRCDCCGMFAQEFYEINIQQGPGILAFNVSDCCVKKFVASP